MSPDSVDIPEWVPNNHCDCVGISEWVPDWVGIPDWVPDILIGLVFQTGFLAS